MRDQLADMRERAAAVDMQIACSVGIAQFVGITWIFFQLQSHIGADHAGKTEVHARADDVILQ